MAIRDRSSCGRSVLDRPDVILTIGEAGQPERRARTTPEPGPGHSGRANCRRRARPRPAACFRISYSSRFAVRETGGARDHRLASPANRRVRTSPEMAGPSPQPDDGERPPMHGLRTRMTRLPAANPQGNQHHDAELATACIFVGEVTPILGVRSGLRVLRSAIGDTRRTREQRRPTKR